MNANIHSLDSIPRSRITNVKLWLELMERLSGLSDNHAEKVIEYWRRLVLDNKNNFQLSTAESCMMEAFRQLHDELSPMASGVSEYDEIMSVQDVIDGSNSKDSGKKGNGE